MSKKSLALAQAIQALVSRRFNQTTLGLALQIYHRSGSKELVDILYATGFCCSYDEVKRFRKSAALHACESKLQLQTLLDEDGLVSTWCDNFDLNIFTPNGMRETHSMAIEFVQSSQGTTS